jgi:hypothetical protein
MTVLFTGLARKCLAAIHCAIGEMVRSTHHDIDFHWFDKEMPCWSSLRYRRDGSLPAPQRGFSLIFTA